MRTLFSLFLSMAITTVISQTRPVYAYEYRFNLTSEPAYCFYENSHSQNFPKDTADFKVSINFIDKDGFPLFTYLQLIPDGGDTITLYTNGDGTINRKIPYGNFRIYVVNGTYTAIDQYIPVSRLDWRKPITVVMGNNHTVEVPMLKSKRPLTRTEIIQVIEGIRSKSPHQLIKDKTCLLMFEI